MPPFQPDNTVDQITSEIDLWGPIMQQTALLNEWDREFLPLATIQDGGLIEFMAKGAEQLYMDLNESWLRFQVKLTLADGRAAAADVVGPINLIAHSLFAQVSAELNGKPVGEPNHLYPYRAYLETLINYSKETQKTRLLAEGWVKDSSGHMNEFDTAAGGGNAGLVARTGTFANSAVVELIMRPHLDIFQQDRLIPPGVDLHLKLIPSAASFVCKSPAPQANNAQERFKPVITFAGLYIHTKQLTSEAELAQRALFRERVMRLAYTRVQVKHMSIPTQQTFYNFDNLFTGNLPDLVVVGLVDDLDMAGGYQRNPFNFRPFGVDRIEMRRNGTPVPRLGYTPNFAGRRYMKDYITMQQQFGFSKATSASQLPPTSGRTATPSTRSKSPTVPSGAALRARARAPPPAACDSRSASPRRRRTTSR